MGGTCVSYPILIHGRGSLAPVDVLSTAVLARHTDDGRCRAHQWYSQIVSQSETVYSLHKLLWMFVVMVVYDSAYSDIGTVPQGLRKGKHSVASLSPVMVFHVSTIHVPYAVSCLHSAQGVNHSVVQGYKQRGWLEYRAWLQQVADGMVSYFPIFAVITLLRVDDGFHISVCTSMTMATPTFPFISFNSCSNERSAGLACSR